jgi:hypothetical protein
VKERARERDSSEGGGEDGDREGRRVRRCYEKEDKG